MVNIRSINDIILNLIDYFKLVQPNLDTKPGTVARDLFVDAPATQIALAYEEISAASNLQSLSLSSGADLDKLANNFGLSRKQATKANGTALVTFSSIDAPISINPGDVITSSNGATFKVSYGLSISPSNSNFYRSIAVKFQNDLNFLGISDQYAAQILVEAVAAGSAGNINKYSLKTISSSGVSNVTNTSPFSGGVDQESDAVFRNRVLSIFNGTGVGTALGYKSTALTISQVVDAIVAEPGDPLMTRDGTVVKTNPDGTKSIVSEGSGGKVDVIVLGQNIVPSTDSYVFKDYSNTNDVTSSKNNFVLGQLASSTSSLINQRRIEDIKNQTLPTQPVIEVTNVVGSLSGPNFKSKYVDSYGRVFGNYELVKDTGNYGGSPWGSDYFKWISNQIENYPQDNAKSKFNGQDTLQYTDITKIPLVQQNISITNENSKVVNPKEGIIQLIHTPVSNVTRVFNVNTGERYFITNQNLDGTGGTNLTGRIKISGNTLPSPTDVLQVDYTWIFNYDSYSDYDGKLLNNNIRNSDDSLDWGYSSIIKNEKVLFNLDNTGNFFVGNASHLINSIVKCNKFHQVDGVVSAVTSGKYVNRLQVNITNIPDSIGPINSIDNVFLKNTYTDIYNTSENNGLFIKGTTVVGINLLYTAQIILPTDTNAKEGDAVTIFFNSIDVFNYNNDVQLTNGTSTFNGNTITIPKDNVDLPSNTKTYLNVFYIANVQSLFSNAVSSLPASRCFNGYLSGSNIGFPNQYAQNLLRKENKIVFPNVDTNLCIELDINSTNFGLSADDIVAIIRISDNQILWDQKNQGTLSTNINNNNVYQLIINNINAVNGDQVIVFYYAKDLINYQPFSFVNYSIKYNLLNVKEDGLLNKYVQLIEFTNTTGINFNIIEPSTQTVYAQVTNANLTIIGDGYQATVVGTPSVSLTSILNMNNLKVEVNDVNNINNNGVFDIISFNPNNSEFVIGLNLSNLLNSQVSAIRIKDGLDVWNSGSIIDVNNNKLIIKNKNLQLNDTLLVNFYNFNNLRQSPTILNSNIADQLTNPGSITFQGSTMYKVEDVVFNCNNNGLKINLSEVINSANISGYDLRLVRVVKLEKVETAGSTNEVVNTIVSYDLFGGELKNNLYYSNEFIYNQDLSNSEFMLPATTKNTTNTSSQSYLPSIGDRMRVTFYVVNPSDTDTISYTSSGSGYTTKKFALIDKIYVASGFKSTLSSILSVSPTTQPSFGSRYTAYYNYLAPKVNERISINYNYNRVVSDATYAVENNRPINADVIVKEAEKLLVDVTMTIIVSTAYINNSTIVAQNVKDKLIASINLNQLGGIIDGSDLVNAAYSVSGVDSSIVSYFNFNGEIGTKNSLTAQNNQYFSANNVIVNIGTR